MAKRKRLSPAQTDYLVSEGIRLETKSMPLGPDATRAPIAQVAGEASASAALQELAGELRLAREEGRLIQTLDETQIEDGYLVRDRLAAEDEDFRRANRPRILERAFNTHTYRLAYQDQLLDPQEELRRWRERGVRTPAAPPQGR